MSDLLEKRKQVKQDNTTEITGDVVESTPLKEKQDEGHKEKQDNNN